MVNVTLDDGQIATRNQSMLEVKTTPLRANENYVRDYTLIANTVCVLLLPTAVMLVSTCVIIKLMIATPSARIYSSDQERARKKRNR